jgi:hypothetical protein
VPYNVGDGELRIVASQDLGPLGPSKDQPVMFRWRWYCHFPTLPLWGLILALLVAPKANRHRQAWLVLIPLAVVLLVPRMLATLLSMPESTAETMGCFLGTLAMAWGAVWLAGHWLGCRLRKLTFFLILATMTAIGLLSYWCNGTDAAGLVTASIGIALFSGVLPLSMLWTSYSCRKKFTPGRFRARLLVRMLVPLLLLMVAYMATLVLAVQGQPADLAIFAPALLMMLIGSLVYACVLYLFNLPFLELAFRSAFYRERFERLFHIELPPAPGGCPFAEQGSPNDCPAQPGQVV